VYSFDFVINIFFEHCSSFFSCCLVEEDIFISTENVDLYFCYMDTECNSDSYPVSVLDHNIVNISETNNKNVPSILDVKDESDSSLSVNFLERSIMEINKFVSEGEIRLFKYFKSKKALQTSFLEPSFDLMLNIHTVRKYKRKRWLRYFIRKCYFFSRDRRVMYNRSFRWRKKLTYWASLSTLLLQKMNLRSSNFSLLSSYLSTRESKKERFEELLSYRRRRNLRRHEYKIKIKRYRYYTEGMVVSLLYFNSSFFSFVYNMFLSSHKYKPFLQKKYFSYIKSLLYLWYLDRKNVAFQRIKFSKRRRFFRWYTRMFVEEKNNTSFLSSFFRFYKNKELYKQNHSLFFSFLCNYKQDFVVFNRKKIISFDYSFLLKKNPFSFFRSFFFTILESYRVYNSRRNSLLLSNTFFCYIFSFLLTNVQSSNFFLSVSNFIRTSRFFSNYLFYFFTKSNVLNSIWFLSYGYFLNVTYIYPMHVNVHHTIPYLIRSSSFDTDFVYYYSLYTKYSQVIIDYSDFSLSLFDDLDDAYGIQYEIDLFYSATVKRSRTNSLTYYLNRYIVPIFLNTDFFFSKLGLHDVLHKYSVRDIHTLFLLKKKYNRKFRRMFFLRKKTYTYVSLLRRKGQTKWFNI
jgi:hypothetical protein